MLAGDLSRVLNHRVVCEVRSDFVVVVTDGTEAAEVVVDREIAEHYFFDDEPISDDDLWNDATEPWKRRSPREWR